MANNKNGFPSIADDEDDRVFERTICLIKPNGTPKSDAIKAAILRAGLMILKRKRTHLKPEQAKDFYLRSLDNEINKYYRLYEDLVASEAKNHKFPPDVRAANVKRAAENSKLEEYVNFMTNGPVEILIIAGRGAVAKLMKLIGPEDPKLARKMSPNSLRAKFGGETVLRNALYASTNADEAENEINFFFPSEKSVKVINQKMGEESNDYLSQTVNPILLKGLIQLCRQKPENPLVWLADWLYLNNPNSSP